MLLPLLLCLMGQFDLQKQVDACNQLTACDIQIPYGTYVMSKPWNLRGKESLNIRAPIGTQIIWWFDVAPSVCMDTIGTRNIKIEGPVFALGNTSAKPDCLWIHGRGSDSKSQAILFLNAVKFQGWYNKATVAFIAVENEELHSVDFINAVPNTTALFLSRDNELGITSPFGIVNVNVVTMTSTNHNFYNCAFSHEGQVGNDKAFGITLGTGVHDLFIQGGSTSQGSRGGVMRIAGENNRRITVLSPNWESEEAKANIVIDGNVFGLSIQFGFYQAKGPLLQVNGVAENVNLFPSEALTTSLLQVNGKLKNFTSVGICGK